MNRPKHVEDLLVVSEYIDKLEKENEQLKHDLGVEQMRVERMVELVRKWETDREKMDEFNKILPDALKIDAMRWWGKLTDTQRTHRLVSGGSEIKGKGMMKDEDIIHKLYQIELKKVNG